MGWSPGRVRSLYKPRIYGGGVGPLVTKVCPGCVLAVNRPVRVSARTARDAGLAFRSRAVVGSALGGARRGHRQNQIPAGAGRSCMSRTLLCFDRRLRALLAAVAVLVVAAVAAAPASASFKASRYGALDCNGYSTAQQPLKADGVCTDVKGILGVNNAN